MIEKYYNVGASPNQLDEIDRSIILILDIAWKYIEGLIRGVPFSITKLKGYTKLQYWMTKVKVFKGRNVNLQSMRKKQSEAAIEDDTTTLSQAIEMKVIATNE